jgi:hypothetical protein
MPLEPGLVQICLKNEKFIEHIWYCFQNFMRSLLFTWFKLLTKCASTHWVVCVKYNLVYYDEVKGGFSINLWEGNLDMYIPTLEHLFMIVSVMLYFTHKYKLKI